MKNKTKMWIEYMIFCSSKFNGLLFLPELMYLEWCKCNLHENRLGICWGIKCLDTSDRFLI